jgi:hypothetical protein
MLGQTLAFFRITPSFAQKDLFTLLKRIRRSISCSLGTLERRAPYGVVATTQRYPAASLPLAFYVSPVSGWSSLYPVLGAQDGRKIEVQGIRLSDYLKSNGVNRVDVLKIDVEGAEYEMLLEDDGLLSFDIGSIVMEIEKNPREGIQHTFPELMDFLRKKFSNVAEKKGGRFPIYHCWN